MYFSLWRSQFESSSKNKQMTDQNGSRMPSVKISDLLLEFRLGGCGTFDSSLIVGQEVHFENYAAFAALICIECHVLRGNRAAKKGAWIIDFSKLRANQLLVRFALQFVKKFAFSVAKWDLFSHHSECTKRDEWFSFKKFPSRPQAWLAPLDKRLWFCLLLVSSLFWQENGIN